jgi:hypothetical protein
MVFKKIVYNSVQYLEENPNDEWKCEGDKRDNQSANQEFKGIIYQRILYNLKFCFANGNVRKILLPGVGDGNGPLNEGCAQEVDPERGKSKAKK